MPCAIRCTTRPRPASAGAPCACRSSRAEVPSHARAIVRRTACPSSPLSTKGALAAPRMPIASNTGPWNLANRHRECRHRNGPHKCRPRHNHPVERARGWHIVAGTVPAIRSSAVSRRPILRFAPKIQITATGKRDHMGSRTRAGEHRAGLRRFPPPACTSRHGPTRLTARDADLPAPDESRPMRLPTGKTRYHRSFTAT